MFANFVFDFKTRKRDITRMKTKLQKNTRYKQVTHKVNKEKKTLNEGVKETNKQRKESKREREGKRSEQIEESRRNERKREKP